MEDWLTKSVASFNSLASDATLNDEVVATLTLHPRYVSKSDFPRELLETTGLRAIGSKIERVSPGQWGVEDHPQEALFTRSSGFAAWRSFLSGRSLGTGQRLDLCGRSG